MDTKPPARRPNPRNNLRIPKPITRFRTLTHAPSRIEACHFTNETCMFLTPVGDGPRVAKVGAEYTYFFSKEDARAHVAELEAEAKRALKRAKR